MIEKIGIIGAGTMGRGIAQICASSGLSVTLCDVGQGQLDDAAKSITLIVRSICDSIAEGLEERRKKREEDRIKEEANRQKAGKEVAKKEAEVVEE